MAAAASASDSARPVITYTVPAKKGRLASELDADVPPRKRDSSAPSTAEDVDTRQRQPIAFEISAVPGLDMADAIDAGPLKKLIVFVVLIKCPDGQYNAVGYEKPKWWRVEDGRTFYEVVIGGWKTDVTRDEINQIYGWDLNTGDRRNITDIRVGMRPTNDSNGRHSEIALIISYKKQSNLMRDLAAMDPRHRSVAEAADAAAKAARDGAIANGAPGESMVWKVVEPVVSLARFTLYGTAD